MTIVKSCIKLNLTSSETRLNLYSLCNSHRNFNNLIHTIHTIIFILRQLVNLNLCVSSPASIRHFHTRMEAIVKLAGEIGFVIE